MIIFYNKTTGKINGTVNGRVHPKEHLKMWTGERDNTKRIVVNWKPYQYFDEKGKKVDKSKLEKGKNYNADFEPDHPQKKLFIDLDKKPSDIHNYRVNIKSQKQILVKK